MSKTDAWHFDWTDEQRLLLEQPILNNKIFLSGPAGSGKTTVACERIVQLLEAGISGDSILVVVPQRTLANPYQNYLSQSFQEKRNMPGSLSPVQMVTMGGLARRMVELYWPLIAEQAGFSKPDQPPIFLTLETTQYFMSRVVRPFLDQGVFSSVHIERNRLYSQIIDNLNKASIVGFPYTEVSQRLKSAWTGEPSLLRVFEDAQVCANRFRTYCLENNLLDFSLQVEIFANLLWRNRICHDYLTSTYQHLIVDNIEEDTPVAHTILSDWLASVESVLILYDTGAGYRRFLGADPDSGWELIYNCNRHHEMSENIVNSNTIAFLGDQLHRAIEGEAPHQIQPGEPGTRSSVFFAPVSYFPEMLDWTANQISALIKEGTPPSEIAVLSPYLSDSLRYSLAQRLESLGIATRSHRPSRSLRDEPITRCLFTLAILAHREWRGVQTDLVLSQTDVELALIQAIDGLDLVRARLLVDHTYKEGQLSSFAIIPSPVQDRITYNLGERYEALRNWIIRYKIENESTKLELDHFISKLFGELLSQPGFGFHTPKLQFTLSNIPLQAGAGEITANLIESIQKFRRVVNALPQTPDMLPLGLDYLLMVEDGVLASQYMQSWTNQPEEAVLLSPAYTFLLANRPVDVQFWLDAGSRSWAERLHQPLTHSFVLSRSWPPGKLWTDLDEIVVNQQIVQGLMTGLIRRCRKQVYLGISNFGEQGYEQRGPLLRFFQQVLAAEAQQ